MRNLGHLLLATALAVLLSSNVAAQGNFFQTTGIAGPLTEFVALIVLVIESKFLFEMAATARKKKTEEHLEYIAGGVVIIGIALVVLI
ncbi:MAG: hypothetical protein GOV15_01240, partial [Candidatus Diapherotrites archaeon]|nr:hypothetical protein [Candidatus Diapherotrites archaeon]